MENRRSAEFCFSLTRFGKQFVETNFHLQRGRFITHSWSVIFVAGHIIIGSTAQKPWKSKSSIGFLNSNTAFTDGSCHPNPGPCGAGASVYLPFQTNSVNLKQPVSSSPTRILKTVHRQNWRQFTDRIEDSSSTNFTLYLYGMSQCSPFIVVIMNEGQK